jgi:hypothetical protein
MPSRYNATEPITVTIEGKRIFLAKFLSVDLLQAMSGHRPVSNNSVKPRGMFTALKKGGPTVIFTPLTASDIIGKRVPHSTAKAIPTRSRLL